MDHETRVAIRTGLRLVTAHHPLCEWFVADRFGKRWPVCSGCALTWPSFVLAAVGSFFLVANGVSPLALAAAGLAGGFPQASTLVWRGGRVWRAFVKVVGGLGLGMAAGGVLLAPIPASWKWSLFALFTSGAVAFLLLRLRSILRVCDACPWRRNWAECPGFGQHEMNWGPVRPS